MRIVGGRLELARPALVGILNVTPDSFSDGGELRSLGAVCSRARSMVAAGADLLDIGGESTRPGATPVPVPLELERVLPAIEAVCGEVDVPVSVDTRRAEVAVAALAAGANIINDVSGFSDPDMAGVVAPSGAGWILMHMPHQAGRMGWSERVAAMPGGVRQGIEQVAEELGRKVERCVAAGVERACLAVDPGLGFGKSAPQNLGFLRDLSPIARLGLPIMVGPSRKSFIGAVTGKPADDRLLGTAAAVAAAVLAGAKLIRVHDVEQMREVVDVSAAILAAGQAG